MQISPSDVLGPQRPGRKVVILGDTSDSSQMAALCQAADALVHEATLEDQMIEDAKQKGHSTSGNKAVFRYFFFLFFSSKDGTCGNNKDLVTCQKCRKQYVGETQNS